MRREGVGTAQVVHRTAWHPLLADVFTVVLPPPLGWEVLSELQLNFQPLRVDFVVVRKDELARPASSVMAPLTRLLGPYNVIELTGPTCALEADDFCWTEVYLRLVRMKLRLPEHGLLRGLVVANRLTEGFRRRVEEFRATLHDVEPGIHEVRGRDHLMYVIETEVAGDHILRLLSPEFRKDPMGLFSLLSEEERAIFRGCGTRTGRRSI